MNDLLLDIRQTLMDNVDNTTSDSMARFFKEGEGAKRYGVPIEIVRKIGKEVFQDIKKKPKQEIFNLCNEFWKSKIFEEAYIACIISKSIRKQYEAEDIKIYENWVNQYVNNWSDCDTLCCTTIGYNLIQFPENVKMLKSWAKSKNRWTKRAAAVSLVVPGKKGYYLADVFQIADILMMDPDDMVQKGYGWMLKETSKAYEKEVFDYVMKHKARMPRTALRYAIEKMPDELKAEAMKKE